MGKTPGLLISHTVQCTYLRANDPMHSVHSLLLSAWIRATPRYRCRVLYTATCDEIPTCLPWPTNGVVNHADLKLARKPRVAAHTPPAKLKTCGPATCKEAAGGCPHTREARDNRTYNLQRSRGWLPTHPRSPRQPDLQLAKKPRVAAHTPAKPETSGPATSKTR